MSDDDTVLFGDVKPVFTFYSYTDEISSRMRKVEIKLKPNSGFKVPRAKKQKSKKVNSLCKHSDREYYSKGRCKSCYNLNKYYIHKR